MWGASFENSGNSYIVPEKMQDSVLFRQGRFLLNSMIMCYIRVQIHIYTTICPSSD